MASSAEAFAELFELGRRTLDDVREACLACAVDLDPAIDVRRTESLCSYYDLNDRHIHLGIPDTTTPEGRLAATVLAALLGCESRDELAELLWLFIPRIVAHEVGHHLRHRYGRFDAANPWFEEQIANRFAGAITHPHLDPSVRRRGRDLVRRAMDGLAQQIPDTDIATFTHRDIGSALHVTGRLDEAAAAHLALVSTLFAVHAEDLLRADQRLRPSVAVGLAARDGLIARVNDEYTADAVRYMYCQLGWLYCDLAAGQAEYVDEFRRLYLDCRADTIPAPPQLPNAVDDTAILACHRAYQLAGSTSQPIARYFYKRYRHLLLRRFGDPATANSRPAAQALDVLALLDRWDGEGDSALRFLAPLAAPGLAPLFPGHIDQIPFDDEQLEGSLPTETDRALWGFAASGRGDATTTTTVHRLDLLDRTAPFKAVPADAALELAARLCRVPLRTGAAIVWEGDRGRDVCILARGALEVVTGGAAGETERRLGTLRPFEVFGEMAFFRDAPRSASVRALVPSECYVIRAADLDVLAHRSPIILIRMAGAIAARLNRRNDLVRADGGA